MRKRAMMMTRNPVLRLVTLNLVTSNLRMMRTVVPTMNPPSLSLSRTMLRNLPV